EILEKKLQLRATVLDGAVARNHAGQAAAQSLRGCPMPNLSVYSEEAGADGSAPAYLVLDTESVPDGKLLGKVKYAHEELTPEEAVRRAQAEAREHSRNGSDFLPASFQDRKSVV